MMFLLELLPVQAGTCTGPCRPPAFQAWIPSHKLGGIIALIASVTWDATRLGNCSLTCFRSSTCFLSSSTSAFAAPVTLLAFLDLASES